MAYERWMKPDYARRRTGWLETRTAMIRKIKDKEKIVDAIRATHNKFNHGHWTDPDLLRLYDAWKSMYIDRGCSIVYYSNNDVLKHLGANSTTGLAYSLIHCVDGCVYVLSNEFIDIGYMLHRSVRNEYWNTAIEWLKRRRKDKYFGPVINHPIVTTAIGGVLTLLIWRFLVQ